MTIVFDHGLFEVWKGRLILKPDARSWLASARDVAPFREAPVTHEVAMATCLIDLHHRDPAARFLAAMARTFGLTRVTADTNLIEGNGFSVLGNR
jgi:PIN domain nuclease of toxin-antitoxin system